MIEGPGEYVLATDYDALQAEVAAVEERNKELEARGLFQLTRPAKG
jgi:hypothetical protein